MNYRSMSVVAAVLVVALSAVRASSASLQAQPQVCGERELRAGTVLEDGTIAGEKETLAYLKEKEPALYAKAAALPPAELRARFAPQLMWFQRVGPCRQRQKAESVRRLKSELSADARAAQWRSEKDASRKAELRAALRADLAAAFDSELAVMEGEAASLEAAVEEFRKEAGTLRGKVTERRKSREAVIDKRLGEMLSGS